MWHWGLFMWPMLQWISNKHYIFWVCVCSLRHSACNVRMSQCHLWPAWLYNIFPHYLIHSTIFRKLVYINCVFWFYLQILSATFFILRTEWDIIENVYYSSHSHYTCQILMSWIFFIDSWKILQYQISWKTTQWEPSCTILMDRWTDRKKLSLFALLWKLNIVHPSWYEDVAFTVHKLFEHICTKSSHNQQWTNSNKIIMDEKW
jgi:hypothetical protein